MFALLMEPYAVIQLSIVQIRLELCLQILSQANSVCFGEPL